MRRELAYEQLALAVTLPFSNEVLRNRKEVSEKFTASI